MTLPRLSVAPLLAGLAVAALAFASGVAAEPTRFGTRSLDIPAPDGFEPVRKDLPQVFEITEAYLPPGNRLVEIYLDSDTKAALLAGNPQDPSRYYQLQVLRQLDGVTISNEDFAANMAQVEAEIAKVAPTLDKQAADLARSGNSKLQQQTGTDAQVSLSDVQYDGVFRREPWGLFFTMGSNVSAGAERPTRLIAGSAIVMVQNQLLYLYCYTDDTGPESRRWAQENVVAWAQAIRAANPDDPATEATAQLGSGSRSSGVLRGAIVGALIGAIVGLSVWLLKRRNAG